MTSGRLRNNSSSLSKSKQQQRDKSSESSEEDNRKNKKHGSEEDEDDDEEVYEVEYIIDMRYKGKKKEYFVKWENWPVSASTWEPEEHLENVQDIVEKFEKEYAKKKWTGQLTNGSKSYSLPPNSSNNNRKQSENDNMRKNNYQKKQKNDKDWVPNDHSNNSFDDNKPAKQKKKSDPYSFSQQNNQSNQSAHPYTRLNKFCESEIEQLEEDGKNHHLNNMNNNNHINNGKNGNTTVVDMIDEPQTDGQELVFDRIEDKRVVHGQVEYLIKFVNTRQSQWVQEIELGDFETELKQFNDNLQQKIKEKTELEQNRQRKQKLDEYLKQQEELKQKQQAKQNPSNRLTPNSNVNKNQFENQQQQQQQQSQLMNRNQTKQAQQQDKKSQQFSEDFEEYNYVNQKEKQSKIPGYTNNVNSRQQQQNQAIQPEMMRQKRLCDDMITTQTEQNGNNPTTIKSDIIGDFKTDNMDKLIMQGNMNDLMHSRFEVIWCSRADGYKPQSSIYSCSYLKRNQPTVLIDFLCQNYPHSTQQSEQQQFVMLEQQ